LVTMKPTRGYSSPWCHSTSHEESYRQAQRDHLAIVFFRPLDPWPEPDVASGAKCRITSHPVATS
jgi:hypothetical protein